jgi:hypothetical protein
MNDAMKNALLAVALPAGGLGALHCMTQQQPA